MTPTVVIPTGAGPERSEGTAEWRNLLFPAVQMARVGRTLPSAAFDFSFWVARQASVLVWRTAQGTSPNWALSRPER